MILITLSKQSIRIYVYLAYICLRWLGLGNRVVEESQPFCDSPKTVGWETWCVPMRCRSAKFTICLSKVQVVFFGSPYVNCVKLVDSTLYWWYGLVVGIRDKQLHIFISDGCARSLCVIFDAFTSFPKVFVHVSTFCFFAG